ncbi:sulfatase-like hydrolase/transferase [Nocardioides panacis]|uniref:Sulfatase-like hydrolase/transferase n=1 Tax=Nocardioides panacis TaxID=2849501 RepID=A0A975T2K8_9ACTN|nr:sulfatase-like hydrolase/transferase [Nocardioides panacis]
MQTPSYTRTAEGGLRYNRFHVTALCSPTRAALLTARNNHAVGFGSIGEFSSGFPGYTAMLPQECAPLPRILRDNGYSTAAFGKWHLTPDGQQGPAGPLDRWPTGWGFDYFYGFLGGDAGQWDPMLAENQKIIGTPAEYDDEENPYYLPDAMADRTIEWLHGVRAQDPHKPFFVYFSTGCSHAPHHVASEWADRYAGQFDQGWDRLREVVFARQKELGVVPADAELTARDDAFPAWDDVPPTTAEVLRTTDGGLRRLLRERGPQRRPGHRRGRRARRARQHPDHLDLGGTTAPAWRAPSPDRSTR